MRTSILINVCLLLIAQAGTCADPEFTLPKLRMQPVVINSISSSKEGYSVVITNSSSQVVQGVRIVIAGERCSPPYKPAWPVLRREELNISPGENFSINFPKDVINNISESSEKSCGAPMATEVAITHVHFSNGTEWDLGEKIIAGERYENR